jgi:hypothetical protein
MQWLTAVMKVETDIPASITESPIGQAVIMHVKTFRTGVIVFINNLHNVFHVSLMRIPCTGCWTMRLDGLIHLLESMYQVLVTLSCWF